MAGSSTPSCLQEIQNTLDAHAEAYGRNILLLVDLVNQAVVASAAAEGKAIGVDELKYGLGIVIQTADDAGIDLKGNTQARVNRLCSSSKCSLHSSSR